MSHESGNGVASRSRFAAVNGQGPPKLAPPADPLAALLAALVALSAPLSITIRRPGLVVQLDIEADHEERSDQESHPARVMSGIEADTIEALAEEVMTARQLATAAGYRLNSHYRGVLACMRRRGLLHHNGVGYFRPQGATNDVP